MGMNYFQLLSQCSEEQLKRICERRRLPVPNSCNGSDDGKYRLVKTMEFHLDDNKRLINAIADLPSSGLIALKSMVAEKKLPEDSLTRELFDLGLIFPCSDGWVVPDRVGDSLADFDNGALSFQAGEGITLHHVVKFGFSLALTSVLLRCVNGIRVLKGGLPAKKELAQLLNFNAFITDERDATLVFALLHRMGLLWSREGCVDTLVPAVVAHPPRWVAERAFAKLLEDDLKQWRLPPPVDRRFLMQHLLERKNQVLELHPFLSFLQTLQPFDESRTKASFFPFLLRMGLVATDSKQEYITLTQHGVALAQEYLLRDSDGTENHWESMNQVALLIAQPTLELLTPVLQNPHRLLRLAQLADVEVIDTMVSFRFATNTLIRALDSGISLEEARNFVQDLEDVALPQPFQNLLQDVGERLGEVEVEQGVRLVKTRDSNLANELCVRPELAILELQPISSTVLQVKGSGNAFALLKQAGFIPRPARFLPVSIDDNENLYTWALACLALVDEKGMNSYLEPVRKMIHDAMQRIQSDDPTLFQEIKRRVPMLHAEGGSQGVEETQRILEYACKQNLNAEITYMPLAAHRSQARRVTPRSIDGEHLNAYCHLHQEEMSFRLTRILGVRLLNEKGWVSPAFPSDP
ncbi:MAG: helicase C-terminal domain-containing protein [Holophagaceae bacterium]|nr:helicase C-terminal domain-containing protein [Holophagaceae bacterium]